ncbi:hypothetical protein DFP93_10585 [Aneurinibacillus soli]|uniref:26 kDa periplasmic immunogenic protein n=1 Tax=Aneurinibacillus soli TaxID=1500254 RepID=A0A0U4WJG5_9BACL|nr:SIMPL domain-containing protein [Aneurinibacillus soli]PYE62132.1 hypothetical protein DFP93_10585 [Aneurinibacillus soli]BAU28680.1 26 kDa periplasmic immunogenic protein precursor [Aneurinibacillus soli]
MNQKKFGKALLCVPLLSAWLLAYTPASAHAESTTAVAHTITVTGKGEIRVKPDTAYIQLGLTTTGKTAREAQQKNAAGFESIRKALATFKIAETDIQTVRYSTSPDYSWEDNKQTLKGYQVEQMVSIKYRDLNRVGELLDQATAAGANRIDNVTFTSEKLDTYRMDATDRAIDNARLKADRMATRAGVKINTILAISDGSTPSVIYPIRNTEVMAASMKDAASPSSQLSPGELVIEDYVTVTYGY